MASELQSWLAWATPWLEWATLVLIVVGMLWDAVCLRIPHWVCIAIVALMPIWGLSVSEGVAWLSHFIGFAIAFVIGFLLWRLRWVGGGDVKFTAAIALWIGVADLGFFFVVMSILGAILAILVLLLRIGGRFFVAEGADNSSIPLLRKGAPLPYGIAIGVAAILLRSALFNGA